ncbi:RD21L protein, partial [Jacana jacana]|nr:RD21L protein [Jacana jacana]
MFYMHLLVNKRGPLAKIWLAAHWEKKLTKAHIFECNLETTVEKIISPKFTIALRTSGHLLVGVVRIYHRKAKYLLADCSEALTKMKTAFRPGLVDLPEESFEAAYQSITLPEEFHDFETPLPDLNAIDIAEHFTLNRSRAADITLPEDYESSVLLCDRNFGERNEEPGTERKQSSSDGSASVSSTSLVAEHNSASVSADKSAQPEDVYLFEQDCFGDEEGAVDMIEILLRDEQNGLDKDVDMEEESPLSQDLPENSTAVESNGADTTIKPVSHPVNETMLSAREEEGVVLEPVDDTAVTQRKTTKRKSKLLVDVKKELSCSTIYNQLHNCTDILTTLDLAPPPKQIMVCKQSGSVDKLLSQPTLPVHHAELQMLLTKCFKSHRFKMRRNGSLMESEMKETRREEDATEEPSYLQESAQSETERKIRHESFMLTSQNNRNETHDNCGDTIVSSFHKFQRSKCIYCFQFMLGFPLNIKGLSCVREDVVEIATMIMAFSESSSLANNSLGQEAETRHAESTNVRLPRADSSHFSFSFLPQKYSNKKNSKDSEEVKWSKRTLQLLETLQHLRQSGLQTYSFGELCRKNSRKEAAAKFYILLVLKKQSAVELSQSAPFADITAT